MACAALVRHDINLEELISFLNDASNRTTKGVVSWTLDDHDHEQIINIVAGMNLTRQREEQASTALSLAACPATVPAAGDPSSAACPAAVPAAGDPASAACAAEEPPRSPTMNASTKWDKEYATQLAGQFATEDGLSLDEDVNIPDEAKARIKAKIKAEKERTRQQQQQVESKLYKIAAARAANAKKAAEAASKSSAPSPTPSVPPGLEHSNPSMLVDTRRPRTRTRSGTPSPPVVISGSAEPEGQAQHSFVQPSNWSLESILKTGLETDPCRKVTGSKEHDLDEN